MKKKFSIILIIIIVLIIGLLAPNVIKRINRGKLLEVISGEDMINIPLYSYNDALIYSYDCLEKNTDKTLIFYLSTTCGACIEMLDSISILTNVFNDYYNCIIIWEDEIPIKRIQKHNIDIKINYYLKNKMRLSGVKPYSIMVSNDGKKVIFETNNFESIINKLFYEISKVDLLKSANKYFYEVNQEEVYLLFGTNDCEECVEISQKLNVLQNELTIINISSEIIYENSKNQLCIYDMYEIYMKIYDVKKYPSIIKINENENSKVLDEKSLTNSF